MSDFPLEYPGGVDSRHNDPKRSSASALAYVWLAAQRLNEDEERRDRMAREFDDPMFLEFGSSGEPPVLLPKAVDMMLRAFWTADSTLPQVLEVGDYFRAAELMSDWEAVPGVILITPRAVVADCIRSAVERLLASGGTSASPS